MPRHGIHDIYDAQSVASRHHTKSLRAPPYSSSTVYAHKETHEINSSNDRHVHGSEIRYRTAHGRSKDVISYEQHQAKLTRPNLKLNTSSLIQSPHKLSTPTNAGLQSHAKTRRSMQR